MHPLIRRNIKRAKLVYLWITRILLAPNRFKVPLFTRLRFAIFGGFIGDQVALYDLRKNSKREYLSEFDWYRSRWINEPFDPMLNNKVVCSEILQHYISVPRISYLKNRGRLVAHGGSDHRVETQEVLEELKTAGSLFMKPIGAGKGKGVRRLDFISGDFQVDRESVSEDRIAQIFEEEDGWFLSDTVAQHRDLAEIYPHTPNTIRIITLRDDDGVKVFFAVLRIGTEATVPVDNGSRGGLVANIDLETGELSEARTLWSKDRFEEHPNSRAQIRGAVVPQWEEVKSSVLRVADALPYLRFVGWDILVSESGPVVIEANTSSGVNIVQLWGPQRNGGLGDFYRAHGVIR